VFFRKDLEDHAPDWVPRAEIEHQDGTSTYPLVDEPAVLVWLAQLAALEIHTPQWRFDDDDAESNPDRLVLDLDPGEGAGLPECAQVASWCREILGDMGMDTYPVTSGSKGIHLYAPLDGSSTAEEIGEVAHELARALETDHPDHVVSDMKKTLRRGKVLVDWSQNSGSKTTVCPYSLRGRLRPTVAAPRTWEEIEADDLDHLEFEEVLERIEDGTDPIAPLGHPDDGASAEQARDRLEVYRAKRDPQRTPEPVPAPEAEGAPGEQEARRALESAEPMFVIQEHHASRLHWDFRLEHDGVLVSWAVPKGPPLKTGVQRLAVQTEDHPMEYGTFEGTIPQEEYGGGEVSIWDTGTIEIEKWREGSEVIAICRGQDDGGLGGQPRRFAFVHTGRMGGGRRTTAAKEAEQKNWLLQLMKDQPEGEGTSAGGGRKGAAGTGRERTAEQMSEPLAPMLATLGSRSDIREEERWAYEMKWDGVRAIATITADAVRVASRNGKDLTATFPELQELAEAIDPEALEAGETVLDGEVVALDARDRPSFSRLQQRLGLTAEADVRRARERVEVHLMVFDLLVRGGDSLLRETYQDRREALFETVSATEHVQIPAADHGDVDHAIDLSKQLQLEGVMAKQDSSIYQPGKRARTWIKIKNSRHQEVVIIGWRTGKGERSSTIGSLLLAVPDQDGQLRYAGRVGTGFTERTLKKIASALRSRTRKTPPAEDVPTADQRDAQWVRADLVGEVQYTEITDDGRLRHPVWRGLRPDKKASEVRWER